MWSVHSIAKSAYRKVYIYISLILFCHTSLLHISSNSDVGLYSPNDHVTIICSKELKNLLSPTKKDYLVEFFHSYCGHCISYAPKFKAFATSIREWKPLLEVIVIDCANENNTDFCSDMNLHGFPTLFYYPHGQATITSNKIQMDQGTETMADQLVDLVIKHSTASAFQPLEKKSHSLPKSYIILSGLKKQVAVKAILYFTTSSVVPLLYSEAQQPSCQITLVSDTERLQISVGNSWQEVSTSLPQQLRVWRLWQDPHTQSPDIITKNTSGRSTTGDASLMYYADLHSTVSRVLYQEVAMKLDDSEEQLPALQKFIQILVQYFPGTLNTRRSLANLQQMLTSKTQLTKAEWKDLVTQSKFPQLNGEWVSCLGSQTYYRRYPCGLWTLFHTLTVAEWEAYPSSTSVGAVLPTMKIFIRNFFSCTECAMNFAKESQHLEDEVHGTRSAMLWLWRTHNRVNLRLHGQASEDPVHRKVPFPPVELCPKCRTNSTEVNWIEEEIVHFLQRRYSSRNLVRDSNLMLRLEQQMVHENVSLGFTNLDLLMFIVLSMFTTALVATICWFFIPRRLVGRKARLGPRLP